MSFDTHIKHISRDVAVWMDTGLCAAAGSFTLFRADGDTQLSGKSKGGGVCFYTNSGWCNDVTVIVQHCSPDVESFFIKCKPSYSPCEFASFILLCVSIPLQANVQEAQRKLAQQILCVERTKPDCLFIVLGDFEKAHLSHQVHAIPHAALGHSDHVMVHLVHSSAQTIRLEKEEVLRSGDRDRFKEAKYRGRTQMQTVEMAG
ncbi:hypothetical protein L3Q82_006006 [Scortum barcoo]|uniref:Uncharacterized protein n=1 Tax=Scortum barcoo TaxID=214431 RepID=A0ACB8X2G8_9TELE|nr:hypothetical protein L3Q82_006006 [Scortum barcoo]